MNPDLVSRLPLSVGPEDSLPMKEQTQGASPPAPKSGLRPTPLRLAKDVPRKPSTRQRRRTSPAPKPLVPAAERRSHENEKATDNKWDVTPDGGSAGREGRHFAVANVGNKGKIFLR